MSALTEIITPFGTPSGCTLGVSLEILRDLSAYLIVIIPARWQSSFSAPVNPFALLVGRSITSKTKGARDKRAESPYGRLTDTLPPDLKTWLDEQATQQGMTRSEVLALLLTEARDGKTSMSSKTAAPIVPSVFPGTLKLFSTPTAVTTERPTEAVQEGENYRLTWL